MLYRIYLFIIGKFATMLYVNGPSIDIGIVRVGFHSGRRIASICEELTGIRDMEWDVDIMRCEKIIQSKVDSWLLVALFVLYMYYILHATAFVLSKTPGVAYRIAGAVGAAILPSASSEWRLVSSSVGGSTGRTRQDLPAGTA